MVTENTLRCSQESASGPYPALDASNPHHSDCNPLRSSLILSSHLLPNPPSLFTNCAIPACGYLLNIRIVTKLCAGRLGFGIVQEQGIFLYLTASRMTLGSTQPPIQRAPGALSPAVKRPGREVDHSPPPSAEVKNAWSCTSNPPIRLNVVVFS
jgi:hypothetical protein